MSAPVEDIERLLGTSVTGSQRFAGGDISGATRVDLADGRVVVAKSGPVVGQEGRMLQAMAALGAPVPRVLAQEGDLLLIEYVPSGGRLAGDAAWANLAEAMATLRQADAKGYGWDENYALRDIEVVNTRTGNWPLFWAEKRLLCHVPYLDHALADRIEALATRLPDLLPARPPIALVHGDLWGGNVVVAANDTVRLIDPNAFHGDREVDAATLTVFDTPSPSFFEHLDLAQEWEDRQPIYRLWTWLVHVRLFGASYRPAVERDLAALGF